MRRDSYRAIVRQLEESLPFECAGARGCTHGSSWTAKTIKTNAIFLAPICECIIKSSGPKCCGNVGNQLWRGRDSYTASRKTKYHKWRKMIEVRWKGIFLESGRGAAVATRFASGVHFFFIFWLSFMSRFPLIYTIKVSIFQLCVSVRTLHEWCCSLVLWTALSMLQENMRAMMRDLYFHDRRNWKVGGNYLDC